MATREVDVKVEFKWDGISWTDETTNFISTRGVWEYAPPNEVFLAGKIIIQRASISMINTDNRYSPWNTSGALYSDIGTQKGFMTPCRISAYIDGAWDWLFTGFVKTPKEDFNNNRISFDIWDIGEKLKKRLNTVMMVDTLEHDIVKTYLEAAGLVDGTDFIKAGDVGATIDYSTTLVEYSWLDDEPVWDELADLAQSTGCRVFVSPDGMVHYEQPWRWVTNTDSPEVVTFSTMGELAPSYDDSAYYDEVIVEYTPRAFGVPGTEVWSNDRKIVVDPGEDKEIIARLRYPVITTDSHVANDTYYLTKVNGADASGSFPPTFTDYAQQTIIQIDNSGGTEQLVLTGASIKGRPIIGEPNEQSKKDIVTPLTPRRLEFRGNPYIQSKLQADNVRDILHWWFSDPKMTYNVKGLRGDTDRVLGQKIQMTVPMNDGTTETLDGFVIQNTWQMQLLTNGALQFSSDIECIEDTYTEAGSYFIINESLLEDDDHILWH